MWKALFLLLFVPLVAFANIGTSEDLSPVEVFNLPNTHAGREFVVTFPPCIQLPSDDTVSFALEMFGFEEQVVTVESERSGYSESRTIPPFTIVRWELPQEVAQVYQHMSDADIRADDVYEHAAVNVRTNKKLALTVSTTIGSRFAEYQAIPRESAWETHTALVLPEDSLALEHDTLRLPSHIAITGLEDNTEVRVLVFGDSTCLTSSDAEYGDTIVRVINRGDVFLVSSGARNANLQGTHIQSSIPVGVVISSYKSFTDEFGMYCDIGMEQVYSHDSDRNDGTFWLPLADIESAKLIAATTNYNAIHMPYPEFQRYDSTVALYLHNISQVPVGADAFRTWSIDKSCAVVAFVAKHSSGIQHVRLTNLYSNGNQASSYDKLLYTGEGDSSDSISLRLISFGLPQRELISIRFLRSVADTLQTLDQRSELIFATKKLENYSEQLDLRLPEHMFVHITSTRDFDYYRIEDGIAQRGYKEIRSLGLGWDFFDDPTFYSAIQQDSLAKSAIVGEVEHGVSDYEELTCENCRIDSVYLSLSPRQFNILVEQVDEKRPYYVRGRVYNRTGTGREFEAVGANCDLTVSNPPSLVVEFGDTLNFQLSVVNESEHFAYIDSIWFGGSSEGFYFVDSLQYLGRELAPHDSIEIDMMFVGHSQYQSSTYLRVGTNCHENYLLARFETTTFFSPESDCKLLTIDSLECVRDEPSRFPNRVTITNNGEYPLRIDSLRLSNVSEALRVIGNEPNDSLVMLPGGSIRRTIGFDRDYRAELRDTLHVYHNCGSGHKVILLHGKALPTSVTPQAFLDIHAEVIPNPVGVDARLFIEAAVHRRAEVQFVNMLGEIYATKNVDLSTTRHVSIPSDLSQGVWFAVVRVGTTVVTVPFVR